MTVPEEPSPRDRRYVEALTSASDRLLRAIADEARARLERDVANAAFDTTDHARFVLATAYRKAEAFSFECRQELLRVHDDYLRGV